MNKELQSKIATFQKVLEEIPELTFIGEEVLRTKTQEVSLEEGVAISARLTDVLLRFREITGVGRGLAAPQIGESKSVCVTYVDDAVQTFINPRVVERSEETNFFKELCMSVCVIGADVERSQWVVLEWTDEHGARQKERYDGFMARLLQHEEAHLRGVVNVDEARIGGLEFATFDPLKETLRDTLN